MKGYIYALYSIEDREYPIYIGSTTQKIYYRHTAHRCLYRQYINGKYSNFTSSFILFDKFGFEGVAHKLIKEVEVDSRKELLIHEKEAIQNNNSLNIIKHPFTTQEEKKYNKRIYMQKHKDKFTEIDKKRYEKNREKILEQKKKYREANKEIIAEKGKTYREANKEIIADRDKKKYETNKDKIKQYQKEYREQNKEKLKQYRKEYYKRKKQEKIDIAG